MATYQIETDKGVYEIETESAEPMAIAQPADNAPKAEWDAYYKSTVKPQEPSLLQSEIVSPLASAVSTGLTGGLAKEGMGSINPELKARMFPEQKTIPGKILRGGAELTATLAGLPAKAVVGGINLAAKAAPKYILPAAKSLQGTMAQKVATGTLGGAIGGASLAAEDLDMKKQAAQVGVSAVTGGLLPVAAKPVEKFLSPIEKKAQELLKKKSAVYRNVLNPGKGVIQDVEIKSKKKIDDFMDVAAEENLIIDKDATGKINTEQARAQLNDRAVELEAQLDSALSTDKSLKFNLKEIGKKAKKSIEENFKDPTDMKDGMAQVDGQIQDAIDVYGSEVIDGLSANRLKQGKWSKGYEGLKPNSKKVARTIGWAIKDEIEKLYPDQVIKETNERLGKILTLDKILAKTHGNVVQGGKLGGYFAQTSGAMVGGAIGHAVAPGFGTAVGTEIGRRGGRAINTIINDPARVTKSLPKEVSKFQKLGSEAGEMIRGKSTPIVPAAVSKTPIPSKKTVVQGKKGTLIPKMLKNKKGEVRISGGDKPESFKTAEEYVASKGMLLKHGSRGKIDGDFRTESKSANNMGILGNVETERTGAFFTDSEGLAKAYGDNVGDYIVNVKNPIEVTEDMVLDFAQSIDAFGKDRDLFLQAKFGTKKPWLVFEGELGKRFKTWAKEQGYDGATFKEFIEDASGVEQGGKTVVAFDSNQIQTKSQLTAEFNAIKNKKTPIKRKGE